MIEYIYLKIIFSKSFLLINIGIFIDFRIQSQTSAIAL